MGTVYLIFFTLGVFLLVSGDAAFSHAARIPKRPVRLVGLILAAPYGLSPSVAMKPCGALQQDPEPNLTGSTRFSWTVSSSGSVTNLGAWQGTATATGLVE
jgi:hypothetical protein